MKIKMLKRLISIICAVGISASCATGFVSANPDDKDENIFSTLRVTCENQNESENLSNFSFDGQNENSNDGTGNNLNSVRELRDISEISFSDLVSVSSDQFLEYEESMKEDESNNETCKGTSKRCASKMGLMEGLFETPKKIKTNRTIYDCNDVLESPKFEKLDEAATFNKLIEKRKAKSGNVIGTPKKEKDLRWLVFGQRKRFKMVGVWTKRRKER